MRVMVTGGGTGGHTSPALAIIEELQRRDSQLEVRWVGRRGGVEQRLCAAHAIPFWAVPTAPWPRSGSLRRLAVGAKLGLGVARSALLLARFRPQAVIGVGGYVSLPLVWTAQRMRVPTVIHEQNSLMGMANRIVAPRAERIFLSYPETRGRYPAERADVLGNPVRSGFANPPDAGAARRRLNLDETIPVVLVSGGSQGARSINAAMHEAIGLCEVDEVQFIWMTGKAAFEDARRAAASAPARAMVFQFIEDMVTACAAADVIVTRAGASTTAEIAQMGKPSVLIPYPHAAEGHQEENARAFQAAGASVVLLDDDLTGRKLVDTVRALLGDPDRLVAMSAAARGLAKPSAAESVAGEILRLVFGDPRQTAVG